MNVQGSQDSNNSPQIIFSNQPHVKGAITSHIVNVIRKEDMTIIQRILAKLSEHIRLPEATTFIKIGLNGSRVGYVKLSDLKEGLNSIGEQARNKGVIEKVRDLVSEKKISLYDPSNKKSDDKNLNDDKRVGDDEFVEIDINAPTVPTASPPAENFNIKPHTPTDSSNSSPSTPHSLDNSPGNVDSDDEDLSNLDSFHISTKEEFAGRDAESVNVKLNELVSELDVIFDHDLKESASIKLLEFICDKNNSKHIDPNTLNSILKSNNTFNFMNSGTKSSEEKLSLLYDLSKTRALFSINNEAENENRAIISAFIQLIHNNIK